MPGTRGSSSRTMPGDRDQVAVALEHVVVAQEDDRRAEQRQADDEPGGLVEGEAPRRSGRASPGRSPPAARTSGNRYGSACGQAEAEEDVGREADREEVGAVDQADVRRPRRRWTMKTAAKPAVPAAATGTSAEQLAVAGAQCRCRRRCPCGVPVGSAAVSAVAARRRLAVAAGAVVRAGAGRRCSAGCGVGGGLPRGRRSATRRRRRERSSWSVTTSRRSSGSDVEPGPGSS